MHVAAIRRQVENGIADDLPGAMIGHVSAPTRLGHGDAQVFEPLGRRDDMGTPTVALHSQRDHARMLQEQEQVGHAPGLALLHQLTLQAERAVVVDQAEASDVERAHYTWLMSNVSRSCFTSAMNWSATAPSISL